MNGRLGASQTAEPAPAPWPPGPAALSLCALAMSLAVSLPTIAMLPPWGDEAITLRAIARPTAELIPERLGEAHSPVYFLLLRFLEVSETAAECCSGHCASAWCWA